MTVDMSKLKEGDKVRLRDGSLVTVVEVSKRSWSTEYPYCVRTSDGSCESYTSEGLFVVKDTSHCDIVEIISDDKPKTWQESNKYVIDVSYGHSKFVRVKNILNAEDVKDVNARAICTINSIVVCRDSNQWFGSDATVEDWLTDRGYPERLVLPRLDKPKENLNKQTGKPVVKLEPKQTVKDIIKDFKL